MFKSTFSKYLTAFILIILTSFLILSGIIASMLETVAISDMEKTLDKAGNMISDALIESGCSDTKEYCEEIAPFINTVVNFDTSCDILVTDKDGKVVLSTVANGALDAEGTKHALFNTEEGYGRIDFSLFELVTSDSDGKSKLRHEGRLGSLLAERSVVYATPILYEGKNVGYVVSVGSVEKEILLVNFTRRAVINSSVWVMLAAVIAAYFITERIIHPLRSMKSAAKRFGEGDFTARVNVAGHDEVAELGRAFNNMAESLDSLNKTRNSFLANVSHDLRTPMTTIAGFIDGITSGAIPPEKHEYYLGVISAEVHRLSRLVSQILDVSRLESGERKFNFADFDVAETARLILISFEQKIEDKKLEVEFNSESDEMYAFADKDAIYQVLYNLCHNAIKFSREGGRFAIGIKSIEKEKIEISVFNEGQGISKEDSKMVFDRFFKTDKSRGLDKSGVGLGLYISKTIIDSHGERISVHSVENENCEFRFTLKKGNHQAKRKPSDYIG